MVSWFHHFRLTVRQKHPGGRAWKGKAAQLTMARKQRWEEAREGGPRDMV